MKRATFQTEIALKEAILARQNIVVVCGTSSGKTTFVNGAIHFLDELCPHDRIVLLEDTAELQCKSPNAVFFLTSELAGITMRDLTKVCMRYAGGIGTFHADSGTDALERLEELVEEAGAGPKQKLIGQAIDLIVFMTKTARNTRELREIVRVKGYSKKDDAYVTEVVYRRTDNG